MDHYTPQRTIDEHTRRSLARELSRYYHELADDAPAAPRFSLASVLSQMQHERGLSGGYERELCQATALAAGESFDQHRVLIPFGALATRRDLTVGAGGASGGYLVGTSTADPADVLRPFSTVAQAGATIVSGLRDNLVIPRVTSESTASWIDSENTQYPDAQPSVGVATLSPKHAAAIVYFSRQWRVQSAEAGELLLRQQLLGAVAALLDQALLAGAGSAGAPLGLVGTSGVNTATGTSLALAGLLEMREEILAAGGNEANLRWISTPAVQRVLAARERNSGGGRNLWDDDGILGRPAFATKRAPTGVLVAGDFEKAIVAIWGSAVRVEVNPYQAFQSGGMAARVVLTCDVAFPQASAFAVASSVT